MPVLTANPLVPLDHVHEWAWVVIAADGGQHNLLLRWLPDNWFATTQAVRAWERQGLLDPASAEAMVSCIVRQAQKDGAFGPPATTGPWAALCKLFSR